MGNSDKYNILAKFTSGIDLLKNSYLSIADLVLLDIDMPELNGIDTAIRINYDYPKIKLIAITMYQDNVYLQQLIAAGFNGFVNKTKVPEELEYTITKVMQNRFLFPRNLCLCK